MKVSLKTLRVSALAATLAVAVNVSACGYGEAPANTQESLSSTLTQLRDTNAQAWGVQIPGLAAAVVQRDAVEPIESVSGVANPPGDQSLVLADRFHVGSITKTFTAALIMLLDQEGLLQLDDPISTWIDYPDGNDVTVRMLLGHTSGLPDFSQMPELTHRETPTEAVALAATGEPLFPPGASWSYSNTNYILLGLISQEVTGETWEEQVRSRFFEPLALDSTYIWQGNLEEPTTTGSRMACGYEGEPRCTPQKGLDLVAVTDGEDWTLAWAAGAIVSTPADIARWMAALGSGVIVDAQHLTLMTTPSPQSIAALADLAAFGPTRWTGEGLGLMQYEIDGHGVGWGHEGSINGFVANVVYMADSGATFSVTSNFAMTDSFAALGDLVLATEVMSPE